MVPTQLLVIADRDDKRQLALRAALDLVRGTTAVIWFVGFAYESATDDPALLSAAAARRLRTSLLKDRLAELTEVAERQATPGVSIVPEAIWARDIAAWVNEQLPDRRPDILVKSGHRSESVLYTPTDWRLLRECRLPVMIVRDRLRRKPQRILAAVDLVSKAPVQRALDKRVLDTAAAIATRMNGELHVVCAIPVSTVVQDLDLIDTRRLEARVRRRLARDLDTLVKIYGLSPARIVLKAGPPDRIIDGAASKLKAALVVMGTIGRKGLKGKLLGNTAEQVLHTNRCNVLVLHPPP